MLAGFIIGFDNDTLDTFEHQYRFITDAGIQSAMIGLLTALPKTPLYERLAKEGRLSPLEHASDNTRPGTNVIPKGMPYDAMVESYIALYRRLLADREIALRIRNKLRHLGSPVYRGGAPRELLGIRSRRGYAPREALGILWRLIRKGILPGGPSSRVAFPALDALVDAFARPHRDLGLDRGPVHARLCRAAPNPTRPRRALIDLMSAYGT